MGSQVSSELHSGLKNERNFSRGNFSSSAPERGFTLSRGGVSRETTFCVMLETPSMGTEDRAVATRNVLNVSPLRTVQHLKPAGTSDVEEEVGEEDQTVLPEDRNLTFKTLNVILKKRVTE